MCFSFCVFKDILTFFLCLTNIFTEFESKCLESHTFSPSRYLSLLVWQIIQFRSPPSKMIRCRQQENLHRESHVYHQQNTPLLLYVKETEISQSFFSDLVIRLWLLPDGTCFPSAADWDGQNRGNAPDLCNIFKLNNHCPAQPPWQGDYTRAHDFPTYVIVRKCDDLDQWRIVYDVYFTKVLCFFLCSFKRNNLKLLLNRKWFDVLASLFS